MGAYGVGIYSCDIASDLVDFCQEVYPLVGVEEGNKLLSKEFSHYFNIDKSDMDNDEASFWYALADWQWKRGILNDEIKNKVLDLLADYVGLDQWEEDNPKEAKKRKKVLENLRIKLESPQKPPAKMSPKLIKAKHKIGDVVIVKAPNKNEKEFLWSLNIRGQSAFFFEQIEGKVFKEEIESKTNLDDMYFALLCVEIGKKPHSKLVEGYYDEFSIYAVYDYAFYDKPSLEVLSKKGFLPYPEGYVFDHFKYALEVKSDGWCYKTKCLTFYNYYTVDLIKASCEVKRFNDLCSGYSHIGIARKDSVTDLVISNFTIKKQFEEIGIQLFNLINSGTLPLLKHGDDLIISYIKYIKNMGYEVNGIIPSHIKVM